MPPKGQRAALYIRVSTDGQTTQYQRRVLEEIAQRRGWPIVETFEDSGISGSKGREKRPGFDSLLKAATRRRFDVLMVWSIDRLGRSAATVATTLDDLAAVGISIYCDKEGVDATTPHGRAMLQMAGVFAELERGMIVSRVRAGMERAKAEQAAGLRRTDAAGKAKKAIGRPKVADAVAKAVSTRLAAGDGIVRIAREQGIGVSVVQRLKRELAIEA